MSMTKTMTPIPAEPAVKTGRRNLIEPRDRTLCFMLSESEKLDVDCLAFCINITRSGLLSKIVSDFILAAKDGEKMKKAEKDLLAYLAECREAAKTERWKMAEQKFSSIGELKT
jgi:hypothetical protein